MADHSHRYSYTYTKQISHLSSNNLSFSSTLLEQICRSIDESAEEDSMRKNRSDHNQVFKTELEQMANYQRACMIDKWMEKKLTQKFVVPGKSMADIKVWRKDGQGSSCSSSDSSCGGFFSSSETESFHKPKPVRTEGEPGKNESAFLKTKSRALKMYGDLKKVKKQPISPGGKVAAFLNSLFSAGNLKKTKAGDSKCSSAYRSCLNKTKSSAKLSVRFSPMVENDVEFMKSEEVMMMRIMEERRKVKDQTAGSCEINEEFSYDDFDAESCASSDLFELDNLGMELPVYQTTDIHKIQTMQMAA